MIPLPDLLFPHGTATTDEVFLEELLEMAFLGSDPGNRIDEALETMGLATSGSERPGFENQVFLSELIETCFSIEIGEQRYPIHKRFLHRVLAAPAIDEETIRFRQAILIEVDGHPSLRADLYRLYLELFRLLSLFKAPRSGLRIDYTSFRLEILQQAKRVIDLMAESFSPAKSGLRRIPETGVRIRHTPEYRLLDSLLDYEDRLADLNLNVRIAADGRIRSLRIERLVENSANPFYRSPVHRWLDRFKLLLLGLRLDRREMVNRVIVGVYLEIAPALRTLLQVLGHLELYLAALGFRATAKRRGLEVSIPELSTGCRLELDGLFNPLLLHDGGTPVPCDVTTTSAETIVVVTGPNSGGKTRLLQAIGLAQLLAQSGLFVPARHARLPVVQGLFASLVDEAAAHQTEGRL
jgi:DNA mismatch repair protein MutS2